MTRRRLEVGEAGEQAAREYLEKHGFRIEQVNYRCPLGEIDLVAREGAMLVFVEVRTATGGGLLRAAESVTPKKIKKLRTLASYYLQANYGRDVPCRVDFIAVLLEPDTLELLEIRHIRSIVPGDTCYGPGG